jgi:hypothetical protein
MNTLLSILLIAVAIYAVMAFVASRPLGKQLTALGNVAEGFVPPVKTYYADAAIATRHLLVKIGTDANHIALAGVNDIPLGFATDEAAAAEDGVAVALLGLHCTGALGVASGAIAAGALLVPGANGTVRTLPVAAGSYYIIGRATKAAADTDQVELVATFPILRVVV